MKLLFIFAALIAGSIAAPATLLTVQRANNTASTNVVKPAIAPLIGKQGNFTVGPMPMPHMDMHPPMDGPMGGHMGGRMGGMMGGRRGGMMGGHGGKKMCHNAVMPKTEECLKTFSKGPVNIYFNWDLKKMEEEHKQMMNRKEESSEESSEEDAEHEKKRQEMEKLMSGEAGENMRKMMMGKMVCEIAKFVDGVLFGLPKEKVNVAFGSGNTWYYINGAEAPKANWTAFHAEMAEKINMTEMFGKIKNIMGERKEGFMPPMGGMEPGFMPPPPPPMGKQGMPPMMGMPPMKGMNAMNVTKQGMPPMMMQGNFTGKGKPEGRMGGFGDHKMGGHEGRMGGFGMHARTNVSDNLKWGMMNQLAGKSVPFVTVKPSTFANPSFQIVVTGDEFDASMIGAVDLIIDVGGRYSNLTKNARYTTENVFIASPPEAAAHLIPTLRFRFCQRNGGVSEVQPPKPTRPPKPSTPATKLNGVEIVRSDVAAKVVPFKPVVLSTPKPQLKTFKPILAIQTAKPLAINVRPIGVTKAPLMIQLRTVKPKN